MKKYNAANAAGIFIFGNSYRPAHWCGEIEYTVEELNKDGILGIIHAMNNTLLV